MNDFPKRNRDLKRVLIVDDEKAFLLSLSEGLTSCAGDFCILTAENGEQALRILDSTPVDLVVTDLKMPVMDGFELLKEMKNSHPDIPVIVMSAFLNDQTEQKLASLGVSERLEKPLDLDDFTRRVQGKASSVGEGFTENILLP